MPLSSKDKTKIASALGQIGSGAASGAAMGSIVPGLGTGVGAVLGGLAGGVGAYADYQQGMAAEEELEQRRAELEKHETLSRSMAEVGSAQANQRRGMLADAEGQAARSGLIGGSASEFVGDQRQAIMQSQGAMIPGVLNQALAAERAADAQLMQQQMQESQLYQQEAASGVPEALAGISQSAVPMIMQKQALDALGDQEGATTTELAEQAQGKTYIGDDGKTHRAIDRYVPTLGGVLGTGASEVPEMGDPNVENIEWNALVESGAGVAMNPDEEQFYNDIVLVSTMIDDKEVAAFKAAEMFQDAEIDLTSDYGQVLFGSLDPTVQRIMVARGYVFGGE